MSEWRVTKVNQVAGVNAYYDGHWRIREESLHVPERAFFQVRSDESQANSKTRKKRKRQEQMLAELITAGKFVPLDATVQDALEAVHQKVKADPELTELLPAFTDQKEAHEIDADEELRVVDKDADVNTTDKPQIVRSATSENTIVLPPHSSFVKGDMRTLEWSTFGQFKLIVMDPPWENKSVGRRRNYATFHHTELLKLDIPSISNPDECVLGIWVTNRPAYSSFIVNELLPTWGFRFHATWYWLKICRNGDLVSPLQSTHRLPVEKLLVAIRASSLEREATLVTRLGSTPKVVVSIPLRHSWKPPPESFFGDVGYESHDQKLELFARELRPHWLSIGNDVLHFQSTRLFQKTST
ncbi:hypothetical protein Poli38472_000455 [Pythium oligandrum]|uniref:Methyltransferase-like protein 4 n=1 Tax=Pythium oligandrum TaxID=41045 RepID=A0A8K1CD43_PYTOL|nr:hypothetical protein Poli38472_000455 [Pythium oligandrum]|eukprot:TMW60413.1 hypothetical protein Poli38472_000455 [Pythium oligandrum]